MSGTIDDLVNYRISRAYETLKEADAMMKNHFWNAAINRTYYACFYAVSGLLLKKGIDTSTHKGIRQMFGLHFVQTGIISKEFSRFFSDLYDRRQTGDYDDFVLYDEETSKKLFLMAKEFVLEIDSLIKRENI
jgi:uncharacterized protein (UPF0332 family)